MLYTRRVKEPGLSCVPLCGGRSSILHYGPVTYNLYAPTPNGQSPSVSLNKSNIPSFALHQTKHFFTTGPRIFNDWIKITGLCCFDVEDMHYSVIKMPSENRSLKWYILRFLIIYIILQNVQPGLLKSAKMSGYNCSMEICLLGITDWSFIIVSDLNIDIVFKLYYILLMLMLDTLSRSSEIDVYSTNKLRVSYFKLCRQQNARWRRRGGEDSHRFPKSVRLLADLSCV